AGRERAGKWGRGVEQGAEGDGEQGGGAPGEAPARGVVATKRGSCHPGRVGDTASDDEQAGRLDQPQWLTAEAPTERAAHGTADERIQVEAHVLARRSTAHSSADKRRYTRSTSASPRSTSPSMKTPLLRT